jgi:hypothetical protein
MILLTLAISVGRPLARVRARQRGCNGFNCARRPVPPQTRSVEILRDPDPLWFREPPPVPGGRMISGRSRIREECSCEEIFRGELSCHGRQCDAA